MTCCTVCVILSFMIVSITCMEQYRFTFTLEEYDSKGILTDGSTCDQWPEAKCDLGFNVCVHEFTTQQDADNFGFCPDGYKDTKEVTSNNNKFTFAKQMYGAVVNPLILLGISSWKGMVVKVKAYDVDSIDGNDDIDSTKIIFMSDLPLTQSSIIAQGTRKSNSSDLTYSVDIECINGYESNQCQCLPRNDDTSGHFSCNTDGSITCLTNYYDVTTNCTVECTPDTNSPVHYACNTTSGQKICSTGYTSHNDCSHCADGYYLDANNCYLGPQTTQPTPTLSTSGITRSTIEIPNHCESSEWYLYNGHCYWSSRISGESSSDWFESSLKCRNMGAQLIDINSYSIEANLLFLNQCNKLWLGLVKTNPDSQNGLIAWEWFNNQANNYRNYDGFGSASNSAFQDFRNHRDNGACMTTSSNNTKPIWNSVECSEYENFMCLKQAEVSENPTQNTCPEDGHEINGTCYWISTKEVDYFAAVNHCDELDASLVSIHSAIDNVHIARQLCGDDAKCGVDCGKAWIGLDVVDPSNMGSDDAWGWFDRSPLDYENWKDGDVPDALNEAGCAVIGMNGEWEPEMCFGLHVGVCKSN